jgi:hypothetical protein
MTTMIGLAIAVAEDGVEAEVAVVVEVVGAEGMRGGTVEHGIPNNDHPEEMLDRGHLNGNLPCHSDTVTSCRNPVRPHFHPNLSADSPSQTRANWTIHPL